MRQLQRYFSRLQNTILSRREIEVEAMEFDDKNDPDLGGEFYAQLRFFDDSRLYVSEKVTVRQFFIVRFRYSYHYQRADETLVFRYDNVPHHPEVGTFPHHKHEGGSVVEAQPPDLSDVLREIDAILYPEEG